jgi:hypothetical protein
MTKVKLINRRNVKQFALEIAANRFHRFTPVGEDFFIKCGANLKAFVRQHVERLPSKGKTVT